MSAEAVVQMCMERIPGAVAAGLIDIRLGTMIALLADLEIPEDVVDYLAPATKHVFEGPKVLDIERAFKEARGVDNAERYFQEILVISPDLVHYAARLHSDSAVAVAVAARDPSSLGLFLVRSREVRDTVEIWP